MKKTYKFEHETFSTLDMEFTLEHRCSDKQVKMLRVFNERSVFRYDDILVCDSCGKEDRKPWLVSNIDDWREQPNYELDEPQRTKCAERMFQKISLRKI